MNDTAFFIIAGFIIGIFVTRWIFSIGTIVKTGKTTIGLLILIAKKQGATKEEIDDILDKVYGKARKQN